MFIQSAALDFSKAFDRLQPAVLNEKMLVYGFNDNVISLVMNFLHNRHQCVSYQGAKSKYLSSTVGASQGTKLGPILWLIYCNDLTVEGFQHIKYADDTTFYKAANNISETALIAPAITATQAWSDSNSMLLNAEKTVVMNTSLSNRHSIDQPLDINQSTIQPSPSTVFLGVKIDSKLTFNDHINSVTAKCNSRIFLMRKLKVAGLDSQGLKLFYLTNIRSIVCYASPAWVTILSKKNKDKLEGIQRTCTKVIYPDHSYEKRLELLLLPTLSDYMLHLALSHFKKIVANPLHPLHSRIHINRHRRSARLNNEYNPAKARTTKRANSFFNFCMNFFNRP